MSRAVSRSCLLFAMLTLFGGDRWTSEVRAADTNATNATNTTAAAVEISRVTLGFDGVYKLGYWTTIEIELSSSSELENSQVDVVVPDGDATPARYTIPTRQDRAGQGGSKQKGGPTSPSKLVVRGNVKIGRPDGELLVSVRRSGHVLAQKSLPLNEPERRPAVAASRSLVVMLGELPNAKRSLSEYARSKSLPLEIATITRPHQLPTTWFGYEGVDVVLINAKSSFAVDLQDHPQRLTALDHWIRSGGRLVLATGANTAAIPVSLSPGGSLDSFLPGAVDQMAPLTNTLELEEFCRTGDPLWSEERGPQPIWFVPRFLEAQQQVRVELQQGEDGRALPLVVRLPFGLGEVTVLAADLESEAIESWNGTGRLLAQMLPGHVVAIESRDTASSSSQSSYTDLTGQLRASLDNFESGDFGSDAVQRIPFWLIATLALVYLALIAPGDYWLLRRLKERMEWTWITLPLMVIAGCVVAWSVARGAKGDSVRINQAEVVDVDVSAKYLYGTSWLTLFSPATQSYDVTVDIHLPTDDTTPPDADRAAGSRETGHPEISTLVSWQGLPGKALGGMRSPAAASLFPEPYTVSANLDGLTHVPVSIWSTKTFRVRYRRPINQAVQLDAAMDPGALEPELIGSITNQLNVPLHDCVLLYRRSVYKLGDLDPAVPKDLPERWAAESVRYFLTQHRKYDSEGNDLHDILQAMMFHEQAGGRGYTHLENQYEAHLDLTHQLEAGRPILLGRAERTIATPRLTVGGSGDEAASTRASTFLRFIFDAPSMPASHASNKRSNTSRRTESGEVE